MIRGNAALPRSRKWWRAGIESGARRRAKCLILLAGATGLEPAASGVTGRRSNQLSYAPAGNGADLRRAWGQVKASARAVPGSGARLTRRLPPLACRRAGPGYMG